MAACEGNIRRPGTSRERAACDVRVLVPLDRGLSESGSSSQAAIFKCSTSCELSYIFLISTKCFNRTQMCRFSFRINSEEDTNGAGKYSCSNDSSCTDCRPKADHRQCADGIGPCNSNYNSNHAANAGNNGGLCQKLQQD